MSIFNIKDIDNVVAVFQPLTAPCTARTLAQDEAKSSWSHMVSRSLSKRGSRQRRRARRGRPGRGRRRRRRRGEETDSSGKRTRLGCDGRAVAARQGSQFKRSGWLEG